MTDPLKTEKKCYAYDGIEVKTIQQNGSTGQKIAVTLFDIDKNGRLYYDEVERFNSYTFTSKPHELTMYRNINGEKQVTVVKYEKAEDLNTSYVNANSCFIGLKTRCIGRDISSGKGLYIWQDFLDIDVDYKKAIIDFRNKKASIEGNGRSSHDNSIHASGIELTLNNVDVKEIDFNDGTLNLNNTSDKGLLFDNETKITTCRNQGTSINVQKDSVSKIKIDSYS